MKLNIINKSPLGQADPYILEENGNFYVFATGYEGVHCYKANSLMGDYIYIGIVFSLKNHKEYWAPSVIKINNEFYMYVSLMKNDEEDVHQQTMIVAKSNNIEGPYVFLNKLIEPFSIDSHPVLTASGLYLFYSVNDYESQKAGTTIVVDKMLSPTEMEGKPKLVVAPSIKEEIFMKNRFKEGQDWHTIEGACYFKEGDYQYLLYSANCYQNEYYFVGYSVAKSNETDLRKVPFKKYPDENTYQPLLAKNEYESGTGHNTVIKYNNEWYIIYHGRDIDDVNADDNRTMRIAKIIINGEKLTIER